MAVKLQFIMNKIAPTNHSPPPLLHNNGPTQRDQRDLLRPGKLELLFGNEQHQGVYVCVYVCVNNRI